MRVLLICLTRRGGLLHFNDCLCGALSKICDAKLLCAASAEHEGKLPDIAVELLDTGHGMSGTITKLLSPGTWKRIRHVIRDFDPDVIHVTSAQEWNPFIGFLVSSVLHKPLIYTIHDVVHHEGTPFYYKATETLFRRMPDGFVVLTESARDVLVRSGIDAERILVVPHGVYDFFTAYKTGAPAQKEILFFGRIEPYKGLHVLLKAVRPVLEAHPDWTLHVAGGGDIAPYADELDHPQIRVSNKFLSDAEVAEAMERCSIVALPYLSASQSGVIPTAFAFGKPVIATNVGGIPETVHDGETGLLIEPNDSDALGCALRKLINDPDLCERLGNNGKRYSELELSWSGIASKHVSFYADILNAKNRGAKY